MSNLSVSSLILSLSFSQRSVIPVAPSPFCVRLCRKKLDQDPEYSQPDKQAQLLLVDATDSILWIVDRRTSHPHRITSHTRHALIVEVATLLPQS